MNMRFKRSIRRAGIGATAFFAATAFAAPAAFAAAGADLELKMTGTTLAIGADGKETSITLHNHGDESAPGFKLVFDVSQLDATKVTFPLLANCGPLDPPNTCTSFQPVAPGEALDFKFRMERVGSSVGSAGKLKVTVSSAADTNEANNSVTVDVVLSDKGGADLLAWARDVYAVGDDGWYNWEPVTPGTRTNFWAVVRNQGTKTASGTKITIKLPEHVTFAEAEPDCAFSDGNRTAVCTYEDDVIAPGDDTDPAAQSWYFWPVDVAADVAGPVNLNGGEFTIEALTEVDPSPSARSGTNRAKPSGAEWKDVDPTDNSDEFVVYVGKNSGGQGGGLPVTGAQVGLIAGVGLGAVVGGGFLLLMARRRRVTA